jgi:hypothetical protein
VILGVIAILSLLLAAGAGGALYLSRKSAAHDGAGPPVVEPPATPPRGRLAAVTGERTSQRLRDAGWTIVALKSEPSAFTGVNATYLTATREKPPLTALVSVYDYESEDRAAQMEKVLRSKEGAVVERDGGRILFVAVGQDSTKARPIFDDVVR